MAQTKYWDYQTDRSIPTASMTLTALMIQSEQGAEEMLECPVGSCETVGADDTVGSDDTLGADETLG